MKVERVIKLLQVLSLDFEIEQIKVTPGGLSINKRDPEEPHVIIVPTD